MIHLFMHTRATINDPKPEVYLQPQAKAATVLSNNINVTRNGILHIEILPICFCNYSIYWRDLGNEKMTLSSCVRLRAIARLYSKPNFGDIWNNLQGSKS